MLETPLQQNLAAITALALIILLDSFFRKKKVRAMIVTKDGLLVPRRLKKGEADAFLDGDDKTYVVEPTRKFWLTKPMMPGPILIYEDGRAKPVAFFDQPQEGYNAKFLGKLLGGYGSFLLVGGLKAQTKKQKMNILMIVIAVAALAGYWYAHQKGWV